MSLPITRPSRRLLLLAPLALAGLGGAAAWTLLGRMRTGKYDPHGLPSMLIGKKLPRFILPSTPSPNGASFQGVSSAEVEAAQRPVLVNFFASWCVPCAEEAPVLMQLKTRGVPVYGIAYRDKPAAAANFLQQNGNPYVHIGLDESGSVAIDFGMYGVPETYLVDAHGIVRLRWAGALNDDVIRHDLDPLLQAGS
jgi:cytochrome c biogenesis protein CcmG/thiol:disulfide interchange protein DsbE